MDGCATQTVLPEDCFLVAEEAVDTDWEDGPDFAGLAAIVRQMESLGEDGWWGDTAFDPDQEEVMRCIAPVVAWTASYMASGEDCPESPAAHLMGMVAAYLDWWRHLYVEDDALWAEVKALEDAVLALGEKMYLRRSAH